MGFLWGPPGSLQGYFFLTRIRPKSDLDAHSETQKQLRAQIYVLDLGQGPERLLQRALLEPAGPRKQQYWLKNGGRKHTNAQNNYHFYCYMFIVLSRALSTELISTSESNPDTSHGGYHRLPPAAIYTTSASQPTKVTALPCQIPTCFADVSLAANTSYTPSLHGFPKASRRLADEAPRKAAMADTTDSRQP